MMLWGNKQLITWTNVDQDLWCHMVSLSHNALTQWILDKTADIQFADDNFVPEGAIDNKSALVQLMAWQWTDTSHYMRK